MGTTTPALACSALVKRYGHAVALAGVDLTVEPGAVVGLVGPNGSGKTTALRIAAGIVRPDSGSVSVDGQPGATLAARARTGYVPDEPTGLDELTVGEYLHLVRALYRAGPAYGERAEGLLQAFRLGDRGGMRLGSLSHGLRRSTAIVAALALRPALAVVDEASAALDPTAASVLGDALRALASGGSGVLLATQDLDFARAACDEVALLGEGRIVERGSPAAVLAGFGGDSLEPELFAVLRAGA
jgi:ABC-type multidrug transport system ATPase subunit